jgi:hypothetical protein
LARVGEKEAARAGRIADSWSQRAPRNKQAVLGEVRAGGRPDGRADRPDEHRRRGHADHRGAAAIADPSRRDLHRLRAKPRQTRRRGDQHAVQRVIAVHNRRRIGLQCQALPDGGGQVGSGSVPDGGGSVTFNVSVPNVGQQTLTAEENVLLPHELAGGDVRAGLTRARDLLKSVGLDDRMDHYPVQLSGGEQQRVALARAFMCGPPILMADEPTGNLDSVNGAHVLDLLISLNQREGTTLVLVTHDRALTSRADRIVTLSDGKVVADQMQPSGQAVGS